MFARLVKETLDLMSTLSEEIGPSQQGTGSEAVLPALSLDQQECKLIQDSMMSTLEKSWAWLAGVLDVVEGQLRMGKQFDTKVCHCWCIDLFHNGGLLIYSFICMIISLSVLI